MTIVLFWVAVVALGALLSAWNSRVRLPVLPPRRPSPLLAPLPEGGRPATFEERRAFDMPRRMTDDSRVRLLQLHRGDPAVATPWALWEMVTTGDPGTVWRMGVPVDAPTPAEHARLIAALAREGINADVDRGMLFTDVDRERPQVAFLLERLSATAQGPATAPAAPEANPARNVWVPHDWDQPDFDTPSQVSDHDA